ncbi:MAG: 6-phosphogluconolactonase [Rhizobiaceae bacterium]|nr:MAG: 6-phosphogluconolactonase [Rhizobiaceae bacterium]
MTKLAERHWHEFATPDALAASFSARIGKVLSEAVESRGTGLLAVSGGKTPVKLFQALARITIPWEKVTITLVDERFVPPSSVRSNERLARQNLLHHEAAKAHFVGLYHPAPAIEEAAKKARTAVAGFPYPFDLVVLGMGDDGHTASFFPDATTLPTLLDPKGQETILPVHAVSAVEPRLTFSLPRLVAGRHLALHIEGEEKKATLETAFAGTGDHPMPIRSIFEHAGKPVDVFWAP